MREPPQTYIAQRSHPPVENWHTHQADCSVASFSVMSQCQFENSPTISTSEELVVNHHIIIFKIQTSISRVECKPGERWGK